MTQKRWCWQQIARVEYKTGFPRKKETTQRTELSTISSRPRRDTPEPELPRHNALVLPLCIRRGSGYPDSPITYQEAGYGAECPAKDITLFSGGQSG